VQDVDCYFAPWQSRRFSGPAPRLRSGTTARWPGRGAVWSGEKKCIESTLDFAPNFGWSVDPARKCLHFQGPRRTEDEQEGHKPRRCQEVVFDSVEPQRREEFEIIGGKCAFASVASEGHVQGNRIQGITSSQQSAFQHSRQKFRSLSSFPEIRRKEAQMSLGISDLVLIAAFSGAGAYFSSYLRQKGKNLATKEDIREITKASMISAKIHEGIRDRQLTILQDLHGELRLTLEFAKIETRGHGLAGEDPAENAKQFWAHRIKAGEIFLKNELLIKNDLKEEIGSFFSGLMQYSLARGSVEFATGNNKMDAWNEARDQVHTRLPTLLDKIKDSARIILRSEEIEL
jgi:hypothetical protein